MKHTIAIIIAALLAPLAIAETVKIRMPGEAIMLSAALASLDGADRVVKDATTGEDKGLRIAYDFGKDGVRIRLAIRKDMLALKEALEAYETARVGYVKQIFGVESLNEEQFKAQPDSKRAEFAAKTVNLIPPVPIDLTLFTEADVATFAAAGVPGTTSVALEPLVAKPKK